MAEQWPLLLITPTTSEYAAVRPAVAGWSARGLVQLEMCGIGPGRAAAFARQIDAARPWAGLALIGWAGGVQPDLAAGDAVWAESAVDEEGQQVPCTAIHLPAARSGRVLTVSAPLLTAEAKRAAQRSGVLAVEMEAYPLAAWAMAQHLPFVHARVILDAADEPLPALGEALDPFGRVRAARLARRLLARPRLIGDLWPMTRRLRQLRPVLGALAIAVLEAWPLPATA